MLIKNVNIFTMEDQVIEGGDILIEDGKIKAVGNNLSADGKKVFDGHGMNALPGIIDAHCHIGLWETALGYEGSDGNESTNPITPSLRAIDAINPMDIAFENAKSCGITTMCAGPGSANVIGGQFALLKNRGKTVEDMLLQSPYALKIALGENPKRLYGQQQKQPLTRMAIAAELREEFVKAQNYIEKEGDKKPDRDLSLEILAKVLQENLPVMAHAHRADDIMTVLRISKEFNLNVRLEHCTEGYLIADILKKENAKVILGPLFNDASKVELKNMSFDAPRILYEAGIPFAIMSDHPVIPLQYTLVQASVAVRHGLPEMEAYKAFTINPAKILELDDKIGSITPGKDADIALYDGDALDMRTKVKLTLVEGEVVYQA